MMALTFKKDKRLLVAKDFECVFNQPIKKIHSKHLLVFVRCNQLSSARLGLAITKKKLKNASDRNHLKRLIREQFRHHQHDIDALDLVFIVKVTFDKTQRADIKTELKDIFDKLMALYPKNNGGLT